MNAIDPAHSRSTAETSGPLIPPNAEAARRLARGLLTATACACLVVTGLAWAPGSRLRANPLLAPVLASLLLSLAGTSGTWLMTRARVLAGRVATSRRGRRRWLPRLLAGATGATGRSAHRLPSLVSGGLAALAVAAAWMPVQAAGTAEPRANLVLAAATVVLAFPLLITERVAAVSGALLPDVSALRSLLLLPVLTLAATALLCLLTSFGMPSAAALAVAMRILLTVIGAELVLRAAGSCLLPAPPDHAPADHAPADHALDAIQSAAAAILADTVRGRGLADAVQRHLHLDFTRSWALTFLRAAVPPMLVGLAVLAWGVSGLVVVGTDQRAIFERFGAPVRVLHPGLHLILPWPMGAARRVEYGIMHDTTLSGVDASLLPQTVGAEDLAPPAADRLWEQAHPEELVFLVPSRDRGTDSFQVVSADIKLRYRVGLTDRDALLAAYGTADPALTLRVSATRTIGAFLADRTLDAVLGENRETMADSLRQAVQQELDRIGCGLELTSVVIEAVHPPAGAAEAYHLVQAAEIQASARVSSERGRAFATQAKALQDAAAATTQAQAAAAEVVGAATSDTTRFRADLASDQAHHESFMLERRLQNIATGLQKSATTIIDDRIPADDPMVLDLRPLTSPASRASVPPQD